MPRGDKTGPMGMGAATGRGAGFCTGNTEAGYISSMSGFVGCGMRRGFGRSSLPDCGFRRKFGIGRFSNIGAGARPYRSFKSVGQSRPSFDEEKLLRQQEKLYTEHLSEIKTRLSQIDSTK